MSIAGIAAMMVATGNLNRARQEQEEEERREREEKEKEKDLKDFEDFDELEFFDEDEGYAEQYDN